MRKNVFSLTLLFFSVLVFSVPVIFAEDITITTYYPSPYGSYNAIFVDKLGVGDNNGDSSFTSADVPTTSGNVWIKGDVGIGTMAPMAKLDVTGGAIRTNNQLISTVADGTAPLSVNSRTEVANLNANLLGGINPSQFLRSDVSSVMSGQLWINDGGTTAYALMVKGGYSWTAYIDGKGYLRASAWVYSSDRRLKENIVYFAGGLNKILQLKSAKFDFINGEKNQLGFIAQDVQEVIPEAVVVTDKKTGLFGLKNEFILPYLVNAVKELDAKIYPLVQGIQELWKEVISIKNTILNHETRMQELEKKNADLEARIKILEAAK